LFEAPPVEHVDGELSATATRTACAQAWADALEAYATAIVPPSTTVTAAAAALATALDGAFAQPSALAAMETAFAAFAGAVGGGMAGYTPTPPPAPVGFASLVAGGNVDSHEDAAANWADLIDAWMTTGLSTLIAPPNTV